MRGHGLRIVLAGVAVLSLAHSARAQSGYNRNLPTYHHGGGSVTVQVPPPPLLPGSSGLLEQQFQQMRATSPRPNQFLYGRWNPSYETIRPPVQYQPYPGGYGGGYYYPYPPVYGYPYGGYYNGLSYGGYPYGYQGGNTVIQREVYVYPQNNAGQGGDVQRPQAQPTRPAVKPAEGGDFYLKPGDAESLSGVLDDIRKAWLNGDFDRFQSRLRTDGKLKIFVKGEYRYALEGKEFGAMVKDAMAKIDTVAFEFDRPKTLEDGRVFVSGKHTFVDSDKQKQTTYISYVLEKLGGRWKITEAGSSTAPITGHAG